MIGLLRCPRGHEWEDPFGEGESLDGGLNLCPICREPADGVSSSAYERKGATIHVETPAPLSPEALAAAAPSHIAPSNRLPLTPTAVDVPPPPVDLAVPGYDIIGELGRGGMGVVYQARHQKLNRVVALKMILAGAHAGERALSLFRREAEAVARLQHPNIVQIFEVVEHNNLPFLSLEYVSGGSLAGRLAAAPPSPHDAARLVETLARAMHFAHVQGVIHCDLKPANVLLSGEWRVASGEQRGALGSEQEESKSSLAARPSPLGAMNEPKITDFGLARQLDRDGRSRTNNLTGTPAYMAPEQAVCRNDLLGAATDVYALGAILYECLTGRPPFEGEAPYDVLIKVTTDEPAPPSRLRPKTPRDLETICLKCLQKAPGRRYGSALELAEDLRRFVGYEPIHARPAGAWERTVKWVRRRPTAAALLAVSVLAALGLATAAGIYEHAEGTRVETARAEVRDLLARGRGAADNGAWEKAHDLYKTAQDKIRAEPALAAEFTADVGGGLGRAADRLAADEVSRRFLGLRDDALFHASLSVGVGSAQNLETARSRATEALALVGAADLSKAPWSPDDRFTGEEKSEIVHGCYELMFVLTEAESQPGAAGDSVAAAEKALTTLDRAKALGLETHAYHLRRAACLKEARRKAESDAELTAAAARPPDDASDFLLMGQELWANGAPEKAQAAFVSALRLQPDHFWARYYLALCCTRLQKYEEARDNLTYCLAKRPNFIWVYLLRGFVHGQLNDPAADDDFARADALMRDDPDSDALYVLRNNRGVLRISRGQIAEAIEDLNEAATMKPDDYHAYVSLSQAYRLQKDAGEALRQMDRAVAVAERETAAGAVEPATLALLYRNRSRLHLDRREDSAAVDDLRRAAEQAKGDDRDQARALVEEGRVLQHDHENDAAALAAFDAALRILPHDEDAQRCRAQSLFRLKRYDETVQALDDFLRQGGKAASSVYQTRALAKVKLGRDQDAVADFTLALALAPDDLALRTERGQTYLGCGAARLAVADFDAVLGRDPKNAMACQGRGLARLQLDRCAEAASDAESLAGLANGDGRRVFNAACILAQAAGRLELRQEHGDRETAALSVHCQTRAEALLAEAILLLPKTDRATFWRNEVRGAGALAPLRLGYAYNALDRQYGSDEGP
jgi:serine/threonine protein kinase/predicted Zn-dependent protease